MEKILTIIKKQKTIFILALGGDRVVDALIESMPRRIQLVLKSDGSWTSRVMCGSVIYLIHSV